MTKSAAPSHRQEALRAISHVTAMLGGPLLDPLAQAQAAATLSYAAEQVVLIQELKRHRRVASPTPAGEEEHR